MTFESVLQMHAKRLVEDIAKFQKADPKALWARVRSQTQVGLLDLELQDPLPVRCAHPASTDSGGAIKMRCRAPCLLGFDACPKHAGTPNPETFTAFPKVERAFDCAGHTYFIDSDGVVRDRNGIARGLVLEGVLTLFEVEEEAEGGSAAAAAAESNS